MALRRYLPHRHTPPVRRSPYHGNHEEEHALHPSPPRHWHRSRYFLRPFRRGRWDGYGSRLAALRPHAAPSIGHIARSHAIGKFGRNHLVRIRWSRKLGDGRTGYYRHYRRRMGRFETVAKTLRKILTLGLRRIPCRHCY